MRVHEFLDKYNNAPYSDYEVAELIVRSDIEDDDELVELAKQYLDSEGRFCSMLDQIGYEFG